MTRSYILIFNDTVGTRAEILEHLDTLPSVTHWYVCMPNCIFLTSTVSADTISKAIKEKFGYREGRYLVMESNNDRQGWLPKAAWHLLRNPSDPRYKDD